MPLIEEDTDNIENLESDDQLCNFITELESQSAADLFLKSIHPSKKRNNYAASFDDINSQVNNFHSCEIHPSEFAEISENMDLNNIKKLKKQKNRVDGKLNQMENTLMGIDYKIDQLNRHHISTEIPNACLMETIEQLEGDSSAIMAQLDRIEDRVDYLKDIIEKIHNNLNGA